MNREDKDNFIEELKESEAWHRSITETSIDAIVTADDNDSILTWNKGAERIFGYGSEIIGSPVTTIIPKKYRKAHCDGMKRFLKTGEKHLIGKTAELEAIRKDGKTFPIELSLSAWSSPSGVHFGAIIRDISERKRIEQIREDVQRMMRHDIRAPLIGIIGLARVIKRGSNLTKKQKKAVDLVKELGEKTLKFLDRTRDLFQIEQGVYTLRPETVNLVRVLKNVQEELAPLYLKKRLNFIIAVKGTEIQNESEYLVKGEESLLEIMFANLIKNAIEASPEDAAISVSVTNKSKGKNLHIIDIHNLGVVPQEIRERLFEPYTTSGKKGGTGLGMYSALLVVRVHKGDINFTTSEEKGTNVLVQLPEEII
jgi:PAS domain S-box-containing protein